MRQGLRVGRDGRYELVAKLGEGGMGSVWRATDLQLGREVAIKRIRGVTSAALQERFLRETRALTGLSHPNVVTVFDAGTDGYGTYLVMELVTGKTLAERLKEGSIAPSQAVDLFCAMCKGMSHAHRRGVVHRDLKPSNVMLNEDGVARILDFGLVRLEGSGDLSLTGVGMGTLDYASPEQKQDGGAADERSDVFSLGLVFYEMLMGRRPVPLQIHKLPQPWRDVIAKATEPDVFERHASMDELLAETEAARSAVTHEAAISQAMGKDDDLRCPKCRVVNTLEAKFCRSCCESLRIACPACRASIRAGLKLCDQCSADVGLVLRLRQAVDAVDGLIKAGKLADATNALQQAGDLAAFGRVGANSDLKFEMEAAVDRIAERAKEGRSLAMQAVSQASADQIEEALMSWQNAVAADASLAGDAEAFAGKAYTLQRKRDDSCALALATLGSIASQIGRGSLASAATELASLRDMLGKGERHWWANIASRVADAQAQIDVLRIGMGLDDESGTGLGQIVHLASGIRFSLIEAGSFDMGSSNGFVEEQPVHRVHITRRLWMATSQVTQAQYCLLIGEKPSYFGSGVDAEHRPVETVSWHQAVRFCEAMAKSTVQIDGVDYCFRLPTEAEWEYSCRAGTTTEWHTGASLSGQQANIIRSRLKSTTAVGRYSANAWGLFDMHGNVWEWCLDSWDRSPNYPSSPVSDPFVCNGEYRVVRGGSYGDCKEGCRAAYRGNFALGFASRAIGFRVVFAPVLAR